MRIRASVHSKRSSAVAFTLAEVMISVLILVIMLVSLFAGFSSGFSAVQATRENLRATQIMLQRVEALRLFKWSQANNTNYLKPTFTEKYDPRATNAAGTLYTGFVTVSTPANLPAAYNTNMLDVTITLYWTNYYGRNMTNKLVRTRQMETYVARYGMQNYIYGR